MTSQSSGGSGSGIPGVTSDGKTPGGEVIAGALTAGNPNAASVPSFHRMYGSVTVRDTVGTNVDSDELLEVDQRAALTGDSSTNALLVGRTGALNGHQYFQPMVDFVDSTGSTSPVLRVENATDTILELTSLKSITGSLSLVTDAAAKAVLTSIIAALTGIKVATNDTT